MLAFREEDGPMGCGAVSGGNVYVSGAPGYRRGAPVSSLPPEWGQRASRTTRKPTSHLAAGPAACVAGVKFFTSPMKLAPFSTCWVPDVGGVGSGKSFSLYQSCVHSQTFPNMSWSPNAFGAFVPTRKVDFVPVAAW